MIVGFSKHGQGGAGGAIRYLTDRERDGVEREPSPTILRGDPALVAGLIDSSPFKHRYTSGVLSFAPGERVGQEMEQSLMDRFEAVAFAGLGIDQYAILWVRHEHAGHHELNFLVPRIELSTGKSLNIAPPGARTRETFDTFRSLVNLEYGLADPDDPARTKKVHIPHHIAKLRAADLRAGRAAGEDPREIIAGSVAQAVDGGQITDRAGVIALLRDAGLEINRVGKDYVSVRDGETNEKYRLKGPHFHAEFRYEEFAKQTEECKREFERPKFGRTADLEERLSRFVSARADYNASRYAHDSRPDIRHGVDGNLLLAGQELSVQNGHEREVVETPRLCDPGAVRSGADSYVPHSGAREGSLEAASGSDAAANRHGNANAEGWLRCDRKWVGQISCDPDGDPGRSTVPLRLGGEAVLMPPCEKPLSDDRTRTSPIERLRSFRERLLDAGKRFAQCIVEYGRDLKRGLKRASDKLEPSIERYDEAARIDDGELLRFAEAYRRFELSASRVATIADNLSREIVHALGFDNGKDITIAQGPEVEL